MVIHSLAIAAAMIAASLDGSDKALLRARADNVAANFRTLDNAARRAKVRDALRYDADNDLSPDDLEFVVDAADAACKRYDKNPAVAVSPATPVKQFHTMTLNGYTVQILGFYQGDRFVWNPYEQSPEVQNIYYGVPQTPRFYFQTPQAFGCPGGRCPIN